ncbi:MAG TPA: NAD-binding protein [Thermodesulfobacteriota bacterium]|nr:NAD-binding protein [Thermodesulfobacteriota bacterium]
MDWERQIGKIVLIFISIITFGVAGLMLIEGWTFLDALYMTVITISTVGFHEVHPLTRAGTLFMTGFIILGVGSFLYIVSKIAEYIVAGHLQGALEKKRMEKRINGLDKHYIVCGFGRVGQNIAAELKRAGIRFVVIDVNQASIAKCVEEGYPYIQGNASEDEVLKEAGIMRAAGLVASTDSDAENVYVTLSAKALREDLYVVARASSDEAEHKLLKADADRVLSPYSIAGRRLAGMLLRPNVIELLDVVMHRENNDLMMEELVVRASSSLDGATVGEARRRCTLGANILALKKKSETRIIPSPGSAIVIGSDDLLVALGTKDQLKELEGLA